MDMGGSAPRCGAGKPDDRERGRHGIRWLVGASATSAGFLALSIVMLPGAAGAAKPFRGQAYAGSDANHGPFFLDTSANGREIPNLGAAWFCQGHQPQTDYLALPLVHNISVRPDGRFATTTHEHKTQGTYALNATLAVSGAITAQTTAHGVFRYHSAVLQNGRVVGSCDSGSVRWSANGVAGFAGENSAHGGQTAVFNTKITRLTAFSVAAQQSLHCSDGSVQSAIASLEHPATVKNGSFTESNHDKRALSNGGTETVDITVTGAFVSAHEIKGTLKLQESTTGPSGTSGSSCQSGNVSWSARSNTGT